MRPRLPSARSSSWAAISPSPAITYTAGSSEVTAGALKADLHADTGRHFAGAWASHARTAVWTGIRLRLRDLPRAPVRLAALETPPERAQPLFSRARRGSHRTTSRNCRPRSPGSTLERIGDRDSECGALLVLQAPHPRSPAWNRRHHRAVVIGEGLFLTGGAGYLTARAAPPRRLATPAMPMATRASVRAARLARGRRLLPRRAPVAGAVPVPGANHRVAGTVSWHF